MKALFASLLACLFAFFLGCQQSSITDPVTIDDNALTLEDVQNLAHKDLISYYPGLIKVDDRIFDPSHYNGISPLPLFTEVKGDIRYSHQLFEVDQTPPPALLGAKVKLYINLILDAECPKQDSYMKVVAISDATVYFSGSPGTTEEFIIVERAFKVRNCCCCPMDLYLKFGISHTEVSLVSMELQKCGWAPREEEM